MCTYVAIERGWGDRLWIEGRREGWGHQRRRRSQQQREGVWGARNEKRKLAKKKVTVSTAAERASKSLEGGGERGQGEDRESGFCRQRHALLIIQWAFSLHLLCSPGLKGKRKVFFSLCISVRASLFLSPAIAKLRVRPLRAETSCLWLSPLPPPPAIRRSLPVCYHGLYCARGRVLC